VNLGCKTKKYVSLEKAISLILTSIVNYMLSYITDLTDEVDTSECDENENKLVTKEDVTITYGDETITLSDETRQSTSSSEEE